MSPQRLPLGKSANFSAFKCIAIALEKKKKNYLRSKFLSHKVFQNFCSYLLQIWKIWWAPNLPFLILHSTVKTAQFFCGAGIYFFPAAFFGKILLLQHICMYDLILVAKMFLLFFNSTITLYLDCGISEKFFFSPQRGRFGTV